MTEPATAKLPLPKNVKLFILFRILYNARFYYPIFAVLFLDLGLTGEEFAIVNTVWAITIIVLEVPSGALADQLGRKRMVVIATVLMIFEMALIAFMPLGNHALVLGLIILNRILSGASEAAASGADEALAYDTLEQAGRGHEWPNILERLMKYQSLGFIVSSIVGAAFYDASVVNKALAWVGMDTGFTDADTLRIPLYLTLLTAVMCFLVVIRMREPERDSSEEVSVRSTIRQIAKAGAWIMKTPLAFVLILAGLFYDSAIRLFLTFNSSYYRLIDVPEGYYGLLGSLFAVLGFLMAPVGKVFVRKFGLGVNLTIIAMILLFGLIGVAMAIPIYGVVFQIPMAISFFLISFIVSHFLNECAESGMRATILSFKSLAQNLAYGGIGLLFAGVLKYVKTGIEEADVEEFEMMAFGEAMEWLPGYFMVTLVILAVVYRFKMAKVNSTVDNISN